MFGFNRDKQNAKEIKEIVELIEHNIKRCKDSRDHWLSELKRAETPIEAEACIRLYEEDLIKISAYENLRSQIKDLNMT